jgi:N6-L-threonylcarbamoyladenine synthase
VTVRILALETSCDETAAAVVDGGREVRATVIASQHDLHAEYGGVVPEIASRAHVERLLPVLERTLDGAAIDIGSIDAVAVGNRPGLIGALLVGVTAAKAIAWTLGRPVVGVDHLHAHLYAPLLDTDLAEADVYPALGLVVSGGHTALYRVDDPLRLARLGATIDDAVGEAFDKAAAILGLGHPGGPAIDRLAAGGDDRAHDLPVSRLDKGSLNFSFSGLKTALLYTVRGRPQRVGGAPAAFPRDHTDLTDGQKADLAASFQRAAVRAIVIKLERALEALGPAPRSIIVGGGVSANSRLRAELAGLAQRTGIPLRIPPMGYCLDNAAMIGGLAFHLLRAGRVDDLAMSAIPTTGAGA